jgi:hypothetical protein
MKTIIIVILLTFFTNQSSIEFKFGETITGFKNDIMYYTETDGILYIQHNSNYNHLYLQVFLGNTSNELSKVAEIKWFGTITLPIERGKFWKISYNRDDYNEYRLDLTLRWTPVIGCN